MAAQLPERWQLKPEVPLSNLWLNTFSLNYKITIRMNKKVNKSVAFATFFSLGRFGGDNFTVREQNQISLNCFVPGLKWCITGKFRFKKKSQK